jgi:ABC-type sulfate transport system permease component
VHVFRNEFIINLPFWRLTAKPVFAAVSRRLKSVSSSDGHGAALTAALVPEMKSAWKIPVSQIHLSETRYRFFR